MTIGFNRIKEGDLAKHDKLLVTHESLWSDSFYEDAASLVPLVPHRRYRTQNSDARMS